MLGPLLGFTARLMCAAVLLFEGRKWFRLIKHSLLATALACAVQRNAFDGEIETFWSTAMTHFLMFRIGMYSSVKSYLYCGVDQISH